MSKTPGSFIVPFPPPPLHHGGGMNLRVHPRVNYLHDVSGTRNYSIFFFNAFVHLFARTLAISKLAPVLDQKQ